MQQRLARLVKLRVVHAGAVADVPWVDGSQRHDLLVGVTGVDATARHNHRARVRVALALDVAVEIV